MGLTGLTGLMGLMGVWEHRVVELYLKCELEGEAPLPAAVHVLKGCGLYGIVPPRGPTDVEDALLAEQERQSERRRRALFAASF
jgi:hypothetical protein